MAKSNSSSSWIDPKNGFCSETKIFHSLRPIVRLPPPNLNLSVAEFAFSLFRISNSPETTALIDFTTGKRFSYAEIFRRIKTLAASLQILHGLTKGDTVYIICSTCIQIPILYLSLFSIGVVISPTNPTSTEAEVFRQIDLCKPIMAFATSGTSQKLPPLRKRTILIDSPEFESMMTITIPTGEVNQVKVKQSDAAAILYSSGTTGEVKGVVLTHRNLSFVVAGIHAGRPERASPAVMLFTVPLFHVYGFFYCVKAVAVGECVVLMERFEVRRMLRAIEEFRVTHVAMAPPVLVGMMKDEGVTDGYDLSSLENIACGGAPLGKEIMRRFKSKFPNVMLFQGCGLTESCGVAFGPKGGEDSGPLGSVGQLVPNSEAKIVDPKTGIALIPCEQGELWIRGPMIMRGYVGNKEATSAAVDSEGWLRTGDLCYINENGFMFVVDRLKELIKYKGYQVAPAELEKLLVSHPDIIDAAVIPYPSEEAGQVPMAFVVRRTQSTLDESQVMDFVAKQVAPFKKIRKVAFVASIPKNASGKTLRKDLTKLALSHTSSKL